MKRFSSMIIAAVVVMMAAAVLMTSATPASAKTDGAIVTKTADGCTITLTDFGTIVASLQDVQTPSGNEKFTCMGQVAPGLEPSSAVLFKDIICSGFTGTGTGDIRITPSGNVSATCQIKK